MAEKTNVPGLEDDYSYSGSSSRTSTGKPFSKSTKSSGNGTVISGLEEDKPSSTSNRTNAKAKPVVGILYSVSRTAYGEFWPLYLGPNRIGRNSDNDVTLCEGTVSGNHALLTVLKDDEGIYAAIKNVEGVNGVKLNGKSIRLNEKECNNMDVITVGKNYELLLLLVDCEKYGLIPSEDFIEDKKTTVVKKHDDRIIRKNFKDRLNNPEEDRTRTADDVDSEPSDGTKTK